MKKSIVNADALEKSDDVAVFRRCNDGIACVIFLSANVVVALQSIPIVGLDDPFSAKGSGLEGFIAGLAKTPSRGRGFRRRIVDLFGMRYIGNAGQF